MTIFHTVKYKQKLQLMRIQGKLQLTPKIFPIILVSLSVLLAPIAAFTFKSATVSVADTQINILTTYTISLLRNYDDSLNPTNWNASNTPATANTTITFPSQFAPSQLSGFFCYSVMVNLIQVTGFTCSLSGNTITITNLFSGTDLVSQVDLVLQNIMNPPSALTTDAFICTINADTSSNSALASVSFTPAPMSGLSITFIGGVVNKTNDMIISFTAGNQIPSDGLITIKFPTTLIWTRQISVNNLIPINGTLECYGLSNQINNSTITCKGLYSTQIVTISTLFLSNFPANQILSIGIKGLFAPPTTEQVDSLTVQTCDKNQNAIQFGSQVITGLVAQTLSPYSMQSSLTTAMGVNNFAGGLTFSFTITDTISARDYFQIIFPSGTTITYIQATSTIRTQSVAYNSSNLTLTIFQNNTNPNYNSGTTVTFTFIRYRAPPSTKPTSPITFTVLNSGFSKMVASATITAIANNYTLAVSANSKVVNVYTSYSFSFTMSDALTGGGYLVIKLDPLLCVSAAQKSTITTNLTITISGTNIRSSPSTQISTTTLNGSPSYQLLLSNLNVSSTIIAQSLVITVNNLLNPPYVTTLTAFSLSTYYSSSADLVANANYASSIKLQTGVMTLSSIASTATTTYTFTVLTVTAFNTNSIPSSGYIALIIPNDITLLVATISSVRVGASTVSSSSTNQVSNNTILFQISSSIAASSSIVVTISNIMTQHSTKTTSSFIISSFDASLNPIDYSTNSLGLTINSGNNFNSLILQRNDLTNSKANTYTITFQQIQSYTSVSSVSLTFSPILSTSTITKVSEIIGGVSTPCVFQKSNSSFLVVTLAESSTSAHTIVIENIGNPPSLAILTQPILVKTLNSNNSYIYSQMYTQDIINSYPSSLTVNSYSFSSYVYEQPTNLDLSVTGLTDWPSLIYQLVIYVPAPISITAAFCSSAITNLGCSFDLVTNKVTLQMSDSSNLPLNIVLTINSLTAPPYGTPSQTFTLATYDQSSYQVQFDNTSVIFNNNCSLSCKTCRNDNSSACLSCYTSSSSNSTLLFEQSCVSTCPSSSYQQNSTCIACDASCLTCSASKDNCQSCNTSASDKYYYLNTSTSKGTCLSACSLGTYLDNSTCKDCPSACKSCSSPDYCFQCQSPYYFYNGTCLSQCPNNTLTNSTNASCTNCQSPCFSCSNTTSSCLSCVAGNVLYNNSCSSSCPAINLYVVDQTCQLCDSLCASCQSTASNCTSCIITSNSSHYYNGTCLNSCPELYYSNSSTAVCSLCSSLGIGCSNCSSATTCFTCDSTFLYFTSNQSCLSSTPTGYFNINGTLYSCNSSCNTCDNAFSNCTSCAGSLNLYQNQCIASCPTNITVATNNTCMYCSYPCSTCLNSTSTCLSCQANSSLFYDPAINSCVSSSACPNSTFSDNSTQSCVSCSSSCIACSGGSTNCSKCSINYYLISENNSCSQSCPAGTIALNTTDGSVCEPCTYPCLTCQGTTSYCLSCSQSNATLFLSNGSCVANASCLSGTYANTTDYVCATCINFCSTCLTATICSTCQSNYSLIASNNSCSSTCPSGQAPSLIDSTLFCTPCAYPCTTCSINITTCSSCAANSSLYLQEGLCIDSSACKVGTYANSTNYACQACPSSCASCSSLSNCSLCSSSYFLELSLNTCVSSTSCQNGTVSGYNSTSGRNQCLTCQSPCLTCSLNIDKCTSCMQTNTSLFVLNHSCVNSSTCPSGTFADVETFTCKACVSPCSACFNQTSCITCIVDYYLDGVNCSSLCSSGTYVSNISGVIKCLGCNSTCATCSSTALNCTSCPNTTYLYNNTCLNSTLCPSGTYPNSNTNICTSCSSPCLSCSNQSSCLSCNNISLVLLMNGTCSSSSCPNGTILLNISGVNTCVVCSPDCLTCSNATNTCTSCSNTTKYLYDGACYEPGTCPNGTFTNSLNGTCQKCSSPCQYCSNTTVCQSCVANYYFINSTCSSTCPNGTIAVNQSSSGICQACDYPCSSCSKSTSNCTSCSSANGTLFFYNNTCYNSSGCPEKTYENNQTSTCSSCVSPCGSCTSLTTCLSCTSGLYLNLNSSCLSTCSNGTVAANSSSGGICQLCAYPCSTCSASKTNCTSCSQSNSSLYLTNGSCVTASSCSNGTYANGSTLKCETCLSVCSICSSYSNCNACKSGYYLNGTNCITTCPNGTASLNSTQGGVCQVCTYPCTLCSRSASTCLSCSQANSTLYLSNGSCVSNSSCLSGSYPNSTTLKCESCKVGCSQCSSSSACTSCAQGYYQNGTSCLTTCPNGTVGDNGTRTCVNCLAPCNYCNLTQTNCLSCVSPYLYYSLNNSCLTDCPDGYYKNISSLLCSQCVSPCSYCSSKTICSTCAATFYFFNGSCLKACPSGYFKDSSSLICTVCTNNCSTCSGVNTCTSCLPPFLLSNNICGTSCPPPFIYNASNVCSTCEQAILGCLGCNSSSVALEATCVVCDTGYVLSGGKCVSSSSSLDNTLSNSLKTSTIFPLPFTITGGLLFIGCFMSKFQNKNSYVVGIAYSLFGFIQSSCLIYTIIVYNIYVVANSPALNYQIYLQVALIIIGALNVFGLIVQTIQLNYDQKFGKWLRSKCNKWCYFFIALFSCLINYKFKLIIFTKLFSFYCLRAQLDSVQKFRIFNFMSFFGVGHEGLIIYISAIIMANLVSQQQLFLSFLDLILINTINMALALAVSSKEDTFFQEQEDSGIRINKVFNIYDEDYMNNSEEDKKGKPKEKKGLESRDMLVGDDEDDEFTLSISDRESSKSNINDDNISPNNSSLIKKNKSAIVESEIHDEPQTGNSLKKHGKLNLQSNNFSAVYQGDLSRAKRKQFQQSHKLSKQIAQKSKHSGIEQQNEESEKGSKKQQNIFDMGEQVYEQGENQLPKPKEQSNINQKQQVCKQKEEGNKQKGSGLVDVEENQFDDFQTGALNPLQVLVKEHVSPKNNKGGQSSRYSNQAKQGNKFNGSISSASAIPSIRQIKVYKGKQIQSEQPQDIEQIDLTINKKQRELIQLRKSIRQKERDRERSLQRKSRKNSKEKTSKDALSEFGLGVLPQRSKEMSAKGSQQEPVYSRLEIIQKPMQSSSIVVDDRLLAPVTFKKEDQEIDINDQLTKSKIIDNEENQENERQVGTHISRIDQTNETKYQKQSLVRQMQVIEQMHPSKEQENKNIRVDFQQIDHQYNDNKYEISPRHENLQIQEITYEQFKQPMSQERKLQPQSQNIFEYKEFDNSNSFIVDEQPSQAENRKGLLKKKPVGFLVKPHKKIEQEEFNQFQDNQANINFQMAPDSENNPLDNKLKNLQRQSKFGGNRSAKEDQDQYDGVDKASRNQISKNRSHLVKQTSEQKQHSLGKPNKQPQGFNMPQNRFFNEIDDQSTFRDPSDKQFTERKFTMNRPPLQNQRPSTTQKKRVYGIKQEQTGRASMEEQQLKNVGGRTSMDIRGFKSKQLQRDEGFQMFAPSSNQKQFDSQELIRQPNKPTISRVARIRQGESVKEQQDSLNNSFAKKSIKSYKSRSIQREQYEQSSKNSNSRKDLRGQESGLQEYYKRGMESPSNRSKKSKSKSKNRSSEKRDRQIEKIYLQRLEIKK